MTALLCIAVARLLTAPYRPVTALDKWIDVAFAVLMVGYAICHLVGRLPRKVRP